MEHLLVAWQVLSRYCPQAQNVFLGFHYLSSDVTWRVQTGLGPGIVFSAGMVAQTNIQLSREREREHTIAMCVYKQSYECLYKAGALLKWFLLRNMPAWRGNHIPQSIVTFITFHLQLLPFTELARSDSWAKSEISGPDKETCTMICLDRQGTSQGVKFLQPWVNPAEVRTSQTTGLTQETV